MAEKLTPKELIHTKNWRPTTSEKTVRNLFHFASHYEFCFPCLSGLADEALEAASLCHSIEDLISALVDYAKTKCLPVSAIP
jgi:hypothetical protein